MLLVVCKCPLKVFLKSLFITAMCKKQVNYHLSICLSSPRKVDLEINATIALSPPLNRVHNVPPPPRLHHFFITFHKNFHGTFCKTGPPQ